MAYLIGAAGFVVGFIIGWFIFEKRYINGQLKMTETDDKDVYTLFVDDMERILRRKYLLLKIEKHTRK